jgi:superfamily II DNA/RNA helicase
VFVDKQIEADELFKELFKAGFLAIVLHGGQD